MTVRTEAEKGGDRKYNKCSWELSVGKYVLLVFEESFYEKNCFGRNVDFVSPAFDR
jgi:hypothetical protein